ncbi:MAG: Hsp20/alpha crystallin family protein [Rufibacter sp.]
MQRLGSGFDDFMPQTFSSMLDRLFHDSVNNRERMRWFTPVVDAYETENSIEMEVTLPGLTKEDIHLNLQQGLLTISGERHFKKEQDKKKYHFIESHYGTFSRSFQLPDTVDPDKIEAVFENGILHISVPKDERKTAKKRIEVRDGSNRNISLNQNNQTAEGQAKSHGTAPKKKQAVLAHENGTH